MTKDRRRVVALIAGTSLVGVLIGVTAASRPHHGAGISAENAVAKKPQGWVRCSDELRYDFVRSGDVSINVSPKHSDKKARFSICVQRKDGGSECRSAKPQDGGFPWKASVAVGDQLNSYNSETADSESWHGKCPNGEPTNVGGWRDDKTGWRLDFELQ